MLICFSHYFVGFMDTTLLIEKFRKPVLITIGLILVYALAGFVLLPRFMQSKIPELIESETGRKASLERIEFNPFSLELSLQGFSMQEQDSQTFISFSELFTNVQVWASLWNLALVLDEVSLSGPYVRIEALKGERYNFSDLLSTEDEDEQVAEESEGIFPVIINKTALINGKFATIDALKSEPVNKVIKNINLQLERFSTLPDKGADLGFSMALNGGSKLQWNGVFSINPIMSHGTITVEGLKFTDIWSLFLQDLVQFKWIAGTQDISFNYQLSYPDDELLFSLNKGKLSTNNLTFIGKKNTSEFLKIPNLILGGISFDLNRQTLDIETIESSETDFKLWFEPLSTELNYQTIFAANKQKQEPNIEPKEIDQSKKVLPWKINIQDIAINTAKINYHDQRGKDPITIDVKAVDLGLKNTQVVVAELLELTTSHGKLNLQDLVLYTENEGELIKVPELLINDLVFNLLDKHIKINSINTSDAVIKAWLAKNGELNYQSLFASEQQEEPMAQKSTVEKASEKEEPWLLELDEFKVTNYAIQFKDYTLDKPASLNLSAMNFSLTDFNTQQGTRLPVVFSSQFNQHGKIKISGYSILEPLETMLDVAISQIGVDSFEPYINQSAHLDIIGGDFNTQGKLAISQAAQAELKLQYQGNIDIKGLHTRDLILNQDFLKWQKLTLSGVDFNLQPGELKIKSVSLDKPYARVTIKEDKTTNISDVIVANATEQTDKPKQVAKPFIYKIDSFKLNQGQSDFSDYSLILPFVVHLNDLKGDIKNISSNPKAQIKLDLNGKAFDLSPVQIQGKLDADLENLDIAMHFKSFPLPFLSPYMADFSGDKIEKGKMSLDLRYQVNKKQLTASNDLVIDQFELGEKVENPDAVILPLALAAILLKDKDGRITISMPLQGSMDDPEFSVSQLLFDTFINLLTKIAVSPFTAIGAFLGSDADYSVVTFAAGNTEINAEQGKKLTDLASALTQKKELSLEVRGIAYTNQDWPAMKDAALNDQLKQIYADELQKAGKTKRAEYIKLSEDEYQRLLADLFINTFPDLAERSFFGAPKLTNPEMGEFYAVASKMLKDKIKPDHNKLVSLALKRARNTAKFLVEQGKVEQSRIFILDGKVLESAQNNTLNTELSLTVQ